MVGLYWLFLNIDGYVCFRAVFTFAIGTIGLMYWIEPWLIKFVEKYKKTSKYISTTFLLIFILDCVVTFIFRY